MTFLIWCVVGLCAGALVAAASRSQGLVQRTETLAVGVFGAVLGGDFLASLLAGAAADDAFHGSSLLLAGGGAALMLGLLVAMRRSAGPLKPHRLRRR